MKPRKKQVKIAYDKCKEKIPNRPPDEIDFGLGFQAGLNWVLKHRKPYYDIEDKKVVATDSDIINQELQ